MLVQLLILPVGFGRVLPALADGQEEDLHFPRGDRLGHMVLLRVDAGPLVPRLRSELAALLTSLTDGDWAQPTSCPGWSVHNVAAHLLGALPR